MKVIFLSYANSTTDPLRFLTEEDDANYNTLQKRAYQQHFFLHRDSNTSTEKISEYLTLYKDNIHLFLYSGHADRHHLFIEEEGARSEGICQMLSQCDNLKLVVLNGCSTEGQVQALLDAGIPIVIGTSAPVNDKKAKDFSVTFFQNLKEGASIESAFELAIGAAQVSGQIQVNRGEDEAYRAGRKSGSKTPAWGLFYKEENKEILEESLPNHTIIPQPDNYRPNERLTQNLWTALKDYSRKIQMQHIMEEEGESVEEGDKHVAILNSLPRPIAEHLRKLLCPVEDENQGYDKISLARLKQIATSFETIMEFLTYVLLAQIWEFSFESKLASPELKALVKAYLKRKPQQRQAYDFNPLLLELDQELKKNNIPYFIEEMDIQQMFEKPAFHDAHLFLNILRKKIQEEAIAPYEIKELCIRAEESLAEIVSELGYLGKYTLAAVKNIDVLRYRHKSVTSFNHGMVKLMRVFGKLQEEELELDRYLYNRSVLLLKKNKKDGGKNTQELSLSPFIIDDNAFYLKTDLSKLFFFSSFQKNTGSYIYRHIIRPDDPLLEVNEEKYELVKEQFDVFKQMICPD